MLILQRKKNESIAIGDDIKITILDVGNDQVKIAIDAPRSVPIARSELLEAADANKEAASSSPTALAGLLNGKLKGEAATHENEHKNGLSL